MTWLEALQIKENQIDILVIFLDLVIDGGRGEGEGLKLCLGRGIKSLMFWESKPFICKIKDTI